MKKVAEKDGRSIRKIRKQNLLLIRTFSFQFLRFLSFTSEFYPEINVFLTYVCSIYL